MREFSQDFQSELSALMKWRRDVRHFKTDTVPQDLIQECLDVFQDAPSVGLSEPWRIVQLKTDASRQKALENFQSANADALADYDGEKANLYASLKLSGMKDAPVQLAIFCEEDTPKGGGLGAQTMPEMRRYSVVAAIMTFWLKARAHGLGLGWVSILDPDQLRADLDVPNNWTLVAYLCMGYPQQETLTPELETVGWEARDPELTKVIER
ncbi:5,6-dimethylbenzimidazole synthase [Amylibacter sp. SFDW26]|uniref:5,6-dimethylbenzimidazole synthase n=1 Tax=Amylibacter sp. SFDW26 TaxID=2652722 RepID=UPI0012624789|nr:5,6-dimethylbenzimidazole synthase [Amylibacter sp. SFDW26]KAB7613926.1 5,6-dimethylbenzimidazole synthase [Amylibacter sp. SFDW26]